MGDAPVAHGAFSDVWMGRWVDPIDRQTKKVCVACCMVHAPIHYILTRTIGLQVALKYLRQIMVNNVREKLLKVSMRESTWHDMLNLACIAFASGGTSMAPALPQEHQPTLRHCAESNQHRHGVAVVLERDVNILH